MSQERQAQRAPSTHLAHFTDQHLAYHEAGHAVMLYLQGGKVARLSIDREDARRGTHPVPKQATTGSAAVDAKEELRNEELRNEELRNEIATYLGGEAAQVIRGDSASLVAAGSRSDRAGALRAAARLGVDEAAARAMIDAEAPRVRERLRSPKAWKLVEALATALAREKVLDADQIDTILHGG